MAQVVSSEAPLVLLGAGGHARSVAAAAGSAGYRVLAVHGASASEWIVPVLKDIEEVRALLTRTGALIVPAIGDNHARLRASQRWAAMLGSVIARTATVAPDVDVPAGAVVLEHAHVGPGTTLADHVLVNTGAIIEHDCSVGAGAHLAPGSRLLGGVTIGPGVLVGAGATILPGVTVHAESLVGAGAVVVNDVAPATTVAGMPARAVSRSRGTPNA